MHTRRILVADDDPDTVESFAALLSLAGHEVRCAANGADALRVYEEMHPDTVVLDISMPIVDGYEVARRIRAGDGDRKVLLLALSGWGRPSDVEISLASGFDHHLVKPVDFGDVSSLL